MVVIVHGSSENYNNNLIQDHWTSLVQSKIGCGLEHELPNAWLDTPGFVGLQMAGSSENGDESAGNGSAGNETLYLWMFNERLIEGLECLNYYATIYVMILYVYDQPALMIDPWPRLRKHTGCLKRGAGPWSGWERTWRFIL